MKKRILLVEDDGIIAIANRRVLEQEGYEVHVSYNGEAAVDLVRESCTSLDCMFDLVLMDINLGSGMDGTEAAKAILEIRDIPVVFLSSHTEPDVVRKTEQITSYGYVVKSSPNSVLYASINMAFRLHEARRAAERAERRNRVLSFIANSRNSVVIITDRERNTTWVNEACESLTGYTREELMGKNPGRLLQGPDTDPATVAEIIRALDVPAEYHGEILNYAKDGSKYWIDMDIQPVFDESGVHTHFVAIQRNVSERREVEEVLRARNHRMQSIADLSSDGICTISADGAVAYANDAYVELTGYPREEIVGLTPDRIRLQIPEEDASFIFERVYQALADKVRAMTYRYRFVRGDGSIIWREDSVVVFYDSNGVLETSYVFTRNINDLAPVNPSFRIEQ